jgi:hypothetical protein
MDGRNGGAMGSNTKSKRTKEKKNNVVTMTPKEFGDDAAAVENSDEAAAEKTPGDAERKTTEKEDKKEHKKEHKGARKALRHAVKKAVKENCGPIAARLVKKAESGDTKSAELMVSLMEKKKKGGDGDFDYDGPSLAEQLAAEPSWDEMQEEKRLASEKATRIAAA